MSYFNHLDNPTEGSLVVKSRAPIYPWYERIDPLYEIEYKDSILMPWDSISAIKYSLMPNAQGILERRVDTIHSPIKESPSILYSPIAILAMSLIYQYHQLSTIQISCFLGIDRVRLWKFVSALHNAGVLKRSIPPWWTNENDSLADGSGSVWSIDFHSWTTETWFNDIGPLEWAMITGGDLTPPSSQTPTTIRHNMVTADTILKALEVCPGVIGAWGDRVTGGGYLYSNVNTITGEITRGNIGDGAIVTRDGRIIVIETVGAAKFAIRGTGYRISDKAAAWVGIAAKLDLDLSVVFMNSNKRANHSGLEKFVRYGVEFESKKYVVSKSKRKIGQEKIYFVDGYDWFPGPRLIDPLFEELTAYSPYRNEWVKLAPADAPLVKNDVVINTVLSLHTPNWVNDAPA